jgi:hypothetical protein
MDLKNDTRGIGGSAEVAHAKPLNLLMAEVPAEVESTPLKSLKTKRRLGGAEVPHTPYARARASASRRAFGLGQQIGAAP